MHHLHRQYSQIATTTDRWLHNSYTHVATHADQYLLLYTSILFFICGLLFLLSPERGSFLDAAFTIREFVIGFWAFLIFLVLYVNLPGPTVYWRVGIRIAVSTSVTLVFIGLIRKFMIRHQIKHELEEMKKYDRLR